MKFFKVDATGAVPVPNKGLLHIGVQQTVYSGVDFTGHEAFAGIVVASIGIGLIHKGDDPRHALHIRYHKDLHGSRSVEFAPGPGCRVPACRPNRGMRTAN